MTPLEQWTAWCWVTFWAVWFFALFFTKRSVWQQSPSERLSYGVPMWIAFVALFLSFSHRGVEAFTTAVFPQPLGVVWLGFFVTLAGLLFAIWARFTLGRNWSSTMDLKEGHQLVTRGPYALVRHPIYTGLICMYVGSTLVVGTAPAIVGISLLLSACLMRIKSEEVLMTKQFPNEYPAYEKRTARLVPFVF